jgi:hypothetical protein
MLGGRNIKALLAEANPAVPVDEIAPLSDSARAKF